MQGHRIHTIMFMDSLIWVSHQHMILVTFFEIFSSVNDLFPCSVPFCFTFSICLILSIFRLTEGLLLILWHALIL